MLCETIKGEEAERIGLVSFCVEDVKLEERSLEVTLKLLEGSATAVQWTKYNLNGWLPMAGPIFDSSAALEILGFSGSDLLQDVASLLEKRDPKFNQS